MLLTKINGNIVDLKFIVETEYKEDNTLWKSIKECENYYEALSYARSQYIAVEHAKLEFMGQTITQVEKSFHSSSEKTFPDRLEKKKNGKN